MKPSKKTMRRDEWTRITKKRYISNDYNDYVSGLIIMDKVNETLIVENDYETIKIIDNNYKWLSIAPKHDNYFFTAMYDNFDNLIEVYVDITDQNIFEDISNPCFYDMYLDLYITKDAKVGVLDFDELENAYQNNEITTTQYEKAKISFNKIYNQIKENPQQFINFCNNEYQKLLKKM